MFFLYYFVQMTITIKMSCINYKPQCADRKLLRIHTNLLHFNNNCAIKLWPDDIEMFARPS